MTIVKAPHPESCGKKTKKNMSHEWVLGFEEGFRYGMNKLDKFLFDLRKKVIEAKVESETK